MNQIGVVTGIETVAGALVPRPFCTVYENIATPVNPGDGLNVNVPSALMFASPLGEPPMLMVSASPASLARSEKLLFDEVLIETLPMIVTGYVSSEAEGRAPTAM